MVIKEIRYYESFIEGYSHKYKALPGDDPLFISHFNDTELSYFEDIIPLGMNGEGDGKVNSTSQTTTTGFAEYHMVATHLYDFGLNKDSNLELALCGSSTTCICSSINSCEKFFYRSKANKFIISLIHTDAINNGKGIFNAIYGNIIMLVKYNSDKYIPSNAAFSIATAVKIDEKLDDGFANSSKIYASDGDDIGLGECSGLVSETIPNYNSANISSSTANCVLYYVLDGFK